MRALFIACSLLVAIIALVPLDTNAECVPTYIYKDIERTGCMPADEDWDASWCSTTSNYDRDGQWEYCATAGSLGGAANDFPVIYDYGGYKCAIPFKYLGKWYYNCTTDGSPTSPPWCSHTEEYTDKYGYCDFSRTIGGCDYQFTQFLLTMSYDGTLSALARTVEACQAACVADDSCAAFDFDANGRCYLHNVTTAAQTSPTTGVTHYVRQPCTTTSIAPTTVTEGSGVTTPCISAFDAAVGVMSQGGLAQGLLSLAACQDACINLVDYCYGFDMSANGCFLHSNPAYFALKGASTAVIQYTRVACPITPVPTSAGVCVDTFTKFASTLSYAGTPVPTVLTLQACMDECVKISTCVAFDYNNQPVGDHCYLHTNPTTFKPQENTNADGVDQHVRVPCVPGLETTTKPSGTTRPTGTVRPTTEGVTPTTKATTTTEQCTITFTETANQLSYGGVEQTSARTVLLCKALCIVNAACLGFDFDLNSNCFTHSDPVLFRTVAVAPGVTQFVINRCGVIPATTTTPPPTDCYKSFVVTINMHADKGTLDPNARSLDSCKSACLADAQCVNIDYNNGTSQCWIGRDINEQNQISPISDVNNYAVIVICAATTTAPPVCVPQWRKLVDTHTSGGDLMPTLTTLEACLAACVVDVNCQSADYNNGSSSCWLQYDAVKALATEAIPSVDYYFLESRCAATTSAPATTTAVVCTQTFVETLNQHADGGAPNAANTLTLCKGACLGTTSCFGVDYNNGTSSCWLLMDEAKATVLLPLPNVNNYLLVTTCGGCVDEFVMTPNVHAEKGILQTATTLDACKKTCIDDSACLAVDWTNGTSLCYKILDAVEQSQLSTLAGNDNYRISLRCGATVAPTVPTVTPTSTACIETFVQTTNAHAFNGAYMSAMKTIADCQQMCRLTSGCLAVDFQTVTMECWTHSNLADVTSLATEADVNHYRLTTNCVTTTTVATTTTSTGAPSTVTTTAAPV